MTHTHLGRLNVWGLLLKDQHGPILSIAYHLNCHCRQMQKQWKQCRASNGNQCLCRFGVGISQRNESFQTCFIYCIKPLGQLEICFFSGFSRWSSWFHRLYRIYGLVRFKQLCSSSNLAWSPSKRAQPLPSVLSSRSHSRQLSRESNSDAGTIGSSSTTNIDLVERSPTAAYHNTNTFSHSRSSSGDDHHSRFNNSSHLLAPTHSHHLTAVSGSHTGNTYQIPSSRLRSPNVNLIRERSHSVSVTSSPEKIQPLANTFDGYQQ